jgi:hypothetical protein
MGRPLNLRVMYDAVTAGNIPRGAVMVAGYVDTITIPQWSVADWNLFPDAIHVQIVKKATSIFGNVLDVENGDATAAQVPGWLASMRSQSFVPSVYTSYSNWNAVQQAINSAGMAHPPYWIADYSQNTETWWPSLNGIDAVAWQCEDPGPYDLSLVAPYWEGIDEMTNPFTAYTAPAPILNTADGSYSGSDADTQTSFDDYERFTNASVRWIIEQWIPGVNAQLAALTAAVAKLPVTSVKGTATVDVELS